MFFRTDKIAQNYAKILSGIAMLRYLLVLTILVLSFSPASAQDKTGLEQKFETRHLTIYARDKSALKKIGTYLEWFIVYLDKNWYQVPSSMKIKVFAFPNDNEFNSYIRDNLEVKTKLMGLYKDGCFYTSVDTGLGTLSHEFMHAVFHYTHAKLDPWAHEGAPAFFEKMFGYYHQGNVHFITGFQNPWRIREISSVLKNLRLAQIVESSESQSEQRLVAVFLYKLGYWKRFLDISRTGNKGMYKTCLEAACSKSIESLEPLWQKYISDIVAREKDINKIPGSRFYPSKAAYDEFMADEGKILKTFM